MPPIRNIQIPAKPVKTERSHEENQERAYIAASRRSDRSLEARVESARRASEIHKRRTGRSLRVTEQDVVNEEMYEEEDDDLPLQYRRLTSHLGAGYGSDFNRRLATYVTNHLAMRQALGHATQNNNGQNGGQVNPMLFGNHPFSNNLMTNPGFPSYPNMISPSAMHLQKSAHEPKPTSAGGSAKSANSTKPKSASISTKQKQTASPPASVSQSPQNNNSGFGDYAGVANVASPSHSASHSPDAARGVQSPHSIHVETDTNNFNARSQAQSQPSVPVHNERSHISNGFQPQYSNNQQGFISPITPLTTRLPMESQMFLTQPETGLPYDNYSQQPFYNYNPNIASQKMQDSNAPNGMSQTLAPPAFESKSAQTAWPTPPDHNTPPFSATDQFNLGEDAMFNDYSGQGFEGMFGDGQPTPGEDFFNFIDQDTWNDTAGSAAF